MAGVLAAQLAMVHARFTARCFYNRAQRAFRAEPAFLAGLLRGRDVDLTLPCLPPTRAIPYITAAARAAAVAAAGLAR